MAGILEKIQSDAKEVGIKSDKSLTALGEHYLDLDGGWRGQLWYRCVSHCGRVGYSPSNKTTPPLAVSWGMHDRKDEYSVLVLFGSWWASLNFFFKSVYHLGVSLGWRYWKIYLKCKNDPSMVVRWEKSCRVEAERLAEDDPELSSCFYEWAELLSSVGCGREAGLESRSRGR